MSVAYVFWHRPRADVDPSAYLESLARFHAELVDAPPRGLLVSWAVRLGSPPWPDGGEGWFEDWYVLAGLGALGALERAAVDARRRASHDAAAAGTGEGIAGIYGLVSGTAPPAGGLGTAGWLAKPEGERYEEFVPVLTDAAGAGGTVWQRRLTLGPTPEFAVLGDRMPHGPWPVLATAPSPAVDPAGPGAAPGPLLRAATAQDAPALSELAVRSKGHWGYDESFLKRARPELTVTAEDVERLVVRVATRDGRPLGFSAVDVASAPAELLALWVEPAEIGTGIGRTLLRDALVDGGRSRDRRAARGERSQRGGVLPAPGRAAARGAPLDHDEAAAAAPLAPGLSADVRRASSAAMDDPLSVLGLQPGASSEEVGEAYRRLAKQWHPDRGGGPEAQRRMAQINVAHDLLRAGARHTRPRGRAAGPDAAARGAAPAPRGAVARRAGAARARPGAPAGARGPRGRADRDADVALEEPARGARGH